MKKDNINFFEDNIKAFHNISQNINDVKINTETFFDNTKSVIDPFIAFVEKCDYPYLLKVSISLNELLKKIKVVLETKKNISEDDLTILKFFISDSFRVLERYCVELKKGFEDRDNLVPNKNEPLKFLDNWIIDKNKDPSENQEEETKIKKRKSLFFTFVKGEKKFAINLDHLVEVVNKKNVIKLPIKQKKFAGLVSLRGEIIPILNSPYEIENKSSKDVVPINGEDLKSIIVMNVEETIIGLIADATEEVIELGPKEVYELETLSQDNEKHYVFYKLEEEEILFLDIEGASAA